MSKSYIEDDDYRIDIVYFINPDSIIYAVRKETYSSGFNYQFHIITNDSIESYSFLEGFLPDQKKIQEKDYLKKNSYKKEFSSIEVVNSDFIISTEVYEMSELGHYSTNRVMKAKDYGLTPSNVRSEEDAIFWYFIVLDIW